MEQAQLLMAALKGEKGFSEQCISFLAIAGLFTAVKVGLSVSQFVWRQFLRPSKKSKKYGKWAIVTGATDGIGRQYCDLLAEQGMSMYLVSRTESKLQTVAEEIRAKYSVEVKYMVADLVDAGLQDTTSVFTTRLPEDVATMDVGVLVNNAGMSYDHYEYLHAVSPQDLDSICAINMISLTKMMHCVLPGMKERKRGCIINVSSGVSAYLPACPLLAAYAASKAYVDTLSVSLAAEYREFGIDIQVQPPYFVATKMSKIRKASLTVPTPKVWAKAAIRHMGYEASACVFPMHAIMTGVTSLLPDWLITSQWLKMGKQTRKRAIKKKEDKAKAQ